MLKTNAATVSTAIAVAYIKGIMSAGTAAVLLKWKAMSGKSA